MLRTALFISGIIGLLATAAVAAPTESASTTWRGRGFRRHRPSQGDYVPVYATYRYHSREQRGLFSFLHRGNPAARHHSKKPLKHGPSGRKHTTGLF
ncbi:hypothetical protein FNT36_01840 [Hymenobacter setariae]|uniref:Secreted protein n=1 Tax=Hymenobacter setariae TaxID=2594794 RepID=A0A558C254_9BACT|nr:hypothetical protein [Hymenobacter setariae]TVT42859.1 hypothetical protein FNT36_01840 [Hymenobacter setariae]